MKPLPPPMPGNTEWERFDNAVGMLLNAPRLVFVKPEKRLKRMRERTRAATDACRNRLKQSGRQSLWHLAS